MSARAGGSGGGGGGSGSGGGGGSDVSLRAQLEESVLRERPNVRWDDVAGLEPAKAALQEASLITPPLQKNKNETPQKEPTPPCFLPHIQPPPPPPHSPP